MASLERMLADRLAPAYLSVAGEAADAGDTVGAGDAALAADPLVRRSQHADFQSDGALALAARLRSSPREIATRVLGRADLDGVCSAAEISGPGFINLTVAPELLGRELAALAADDRLGVPAAADPLTFVVDYSAPNAAKEMHVGHLRSTILGDAAVRLLEWLGHRVIRQNHIGEWGTPFGMLIEHLLDIGEVDAAHELSVGDLSGFYQAARRKFDADESFRQRSRYRVVLLQGGDPDTLRLWDLLVTESKAYFLAVYDRLGVRLTADDFAGESSYHDQLEPIADELAARGLLRESAGALCVFPAGFTGRDGSPLPLIVRKSDGGFGYAATDLATIRHRLRDLRADRLLYVVGLPQSQHLEMVYQVAREAGWLVPPAEAVHVGHGSVLGADGRMLRTRAGESVKLIDLLDEAVTRAAAVVAQKNPSLDEPTSAAVARAVGIGAVKYADLSIDRRKDYVFDYDRMLSFDGNTAPYLQFAHARIRSIFRRAGADPAALSSVTLAVVAPAERELAIELLGFAGVLDEVADELEFHRLAGYLYGLAAAFTAFYETCPVLPAEGWVRVSRLTLCDLTARTLTRGLDLLGIDAPDQM